MTAKRSAWRWTGHLARREDERWRRLTTEWQPLAYVAPETEEDLRQDGETSWLGKNRDMQWLGKYSKTTKKDGNLTASFTVGLTG